MYLIEKATRSSGSLLRVSKKSPTVKTEIMMIGDFLIFSNKHNRVVFAFQIRKPLRRKGFDLLRNSPSTVSPYADECELLALAAPLTSASLSKNKFFDRLRSRKASASHSQSEYFTHRFEDCLSRFDFLQDTTMPNAFLSH